MYQENDYSRALPVQPIYLLVAKLVLSLQGKLWYNTEIHYRQTIKFIKSYYTKIPCFGKSLGVLIVKKITKVITALLTAILFFSINMSAFADPSVDSVIGREFLDLAVTPCILPDKAFTPGQPYKVTAPNKDFVQALLNGQDLTTIISSLPYEWEVPILATKVFSCTCNLVGNKWSIVGIGARLNPEQIEFSSNQEEIAKLFQDNGIQNATQFNHFSLPGIHMDLLYLDTANGEYFIPLLQSHGDLYGLKNKHLYTRVQLVAAIGPVFKELWSQSPDLMGGPSDTSPKSIIFTVNQNTYTVSGQSITMDVSPFISNGRTFIPVRYLADALGANTAWDPVNQEVTITKGSTTMVMDIGSSTISINGVATQMDVAAVIEDGRTYLPVCYVAEAFGYSVYWDDATHTITLLPPSM